MQLENISATVWVGRVAVRRVAINSRQIEYKTIPACLQHVDGKEPATELYLGFN